MGTLPDSCSATLGLASCGCAAYAPTPNGNGAPILRIKDVGVAGTSVKDAQGNSLKDTVFDLVIRNTTQYTPWSYQWTFIQDEFGQININGPRVDEDMATTFEFCAVPSSKTALGALPSGGALLPPPPRHLARAARMRRSRSARLPILPRCCHQRPRSLAAALEGANLRTVSGPASIVVNASVSFKIAVLPVPPGPTLAKQKLSNVGFAALVSLASTPSCLHFATIYSCNHAAFHKNPLACLTFTLPTSGILGNPLLIR